jgi:hypothetical protein
VNGAVSISYPTLVASPLSLRDSIGEEPDWSSLSQWRAKAKSSKRRPSDHTQNLWASLLFKTSLQSIRHTGKDYLRSRTNSQSSTKIPEKNIQTQRADIGQLYSLSSIVAKRRTALFLALAGPMERLADTLPLRYV